MLLLLTLPTIWDFCWRPGWAEHDENNNMDSTNQPADLGQYDLELLSDDLPWFTPSKMVIFQLPVKLPEAKSTS